jgi:hypothetical protein
MQAIISYIEQAIHYLETPWISCMTMLQDQAKKLAIY